MAADDERAALRGGQAARPLRRGCSPSSTQSGASSRLPVAAREPLQDFAQQMLGCAGLDQIQRPRADRATGESAYKYGTRRDLTSILLRRVLWSRYRLRGCTGCFKTKTLHCGGSWRVVLNVCLSFFNVPYSCEIILSGLVTLCSFEPNVLIFQRSVNVTCLWCWHFTDLLSLNWFHNSTYCWLKCFLNHQHFSWRKSASYEAGRSSGKGGEEKWRSNRPKIHMSSAGCNRERFEFLQGFQWHPYRLEIRLYFQTIQRTMTEWGKWKKRLIQSMPMWLLGRLRTERTSWRRAQSTLQTSRRR